MTQNAKARVIGPVTSGTAARGLRVLSILLGVFFIFEGIGKLAWLGDAGELSRQLQGWVKDSGPFSRWYLETFAIPGVPMFARLVVIGELATGVALVIGFWTRLVAILAFIMVLNFHVASGQLFEYSFVTSGYGLPVMGGLLALAIGGVRLPFSVSK